MANTIKNADGTYTVHLSATEWEWAAGSVGWEVTTDRKLPRQVKVEEGQDRDGPGAGHQGTQIDIARREEQ